MCLVPNHFITAEACRQHEEQWHGSCCREQGCGYSCESEQVLQEHGVKAHGWKPLKQIDRTRCCETCGKRFANPNSLREHVELHLDQELHCDKCDMVFKRQLNLKRHVANIHGDRTFICQVCSKTFKNYRTLKLHIATYHEERKYKCEICEKMFVTKGLMERHIISVHTKTTPFTCKYGCGRAFNDKSNCRAHERGTHEGNPRGPKIEKGFSGFPQRPYLSP
jgi:KRAB domain-containing zinc finger protein